MTGITHWAAGRLSSKRGSWRVAAALILGWRRAEGHGEALIGCVRDGAPRVRSAACWALGRLAERRAAGGVLGCLEDESPRVRRAACTALGRLGDAQALESLILHAGELHRGMTRRACRAIAHLGEERLAKAIRSALRGRPKRLAALAAEGDLRGLEPLLARIGVLQWTPRVRANRSLEGVARTWATALTSLAAVGAPAVKRLIRALEESADVPSRTAICVVLGDLENGEAIEPLLTRLWDPDAWVRQAAGHSLERLGSGRIANAVLGVLGGSREADPEKAVREIRAMVAEGDRRPLEMLIRFVARAESKPAESRIAACAALGKLRDPAALEALIGCLRDGFTGYEHNAVCRALGDLGDRRAVEPLIAWLNRSEIWRSEAAAEALGKLGDPRAVEPLIEVLGTTGFVSREARAAACTALARLGDPRAIDPIIRCLGDQYEGARQAAAKALGEMGDPRAVEPLIQSLGGWPQPPFGRAVCGALGALGDARAVDPLFDRVSHPDDGVRESACAALEKLGHGRAARAVLEALEGRDATAEFIELAQAGDFRGIRALAQLKQRLLGDDVAASRRAGYLIPVISARVGRLQHALGRIFPRIQPHLRDLLCGSCLSRVEKVRETTPGLVGAEWFACRVCGKAVDLVWGVRDVVAVLDDRWDEERFQADGDLRVNWLRRRSLCDFDRVEILSASDYEVERFCIAAGNDTDELRRGQYKSVPCLTAEGCGLSENTLRVLRGMFGEVVTMRASSYGGD